MRPRLGGSMASPNRSNPCSALPLLSIRIGSRFHDAARIPVDDFRIGPAGLDGLERFGPMVETQLRLFFRNIYFYAIACPAFEEMPGIDRWQFVPLEIG